MTENCQFCASQTRTNVDIDGKGLHAERLKEIGLPRIGNKEGDIKGETTITFALKKSPLTKI